ncbi:hypothetical protein H6G89_20820 [Oscillatoria sp. FACHB-1407]|uniref:hypothetical protein n=1 Tax=Oscillatoria sp. FACHB-1407 TaxID=2692847 RepID=UPI0016875C98|nr:hypothetical protein [Oscillatoria sp. FACHB-1407]MBD2463451.1 hypothetical protein [Oscillatoria sp. FACHB-1407]
MSTRFTYRWLPILLDSYPSLMGKTYTGFCQKGSDRPILDIAILYGFSHSHLSK